MKTNKPNILSDEQAAEEIELEARVHNRAVLDDIKAKRAKPSLKRACELIAMNDNEGNGDDEATIAGYVSTCLMADLFGKTPAELAKTIATIRRNLGYTVGNEGGPVKACGKPVPGMRGGCTRDDNHPGACRVRAEDNAIRKAGYATEEKPLEQVEKEQAEEAARRG